MKYCLIFFLIVSSLTEASGEVVARFNFDPDSSVGDIRDSDDSLQSTWVTSDLFDNFGGSDWQIMDLSANANWNIPTGSNILTIGGSRLRQNSGLEEGQDDTVIGRNYFTFSITSNPGVPLDFSLGYASVMTYAFRLLPNGMEQGNFELFFRFDEGDPWISLGERLGAQNEVANEWTRKEVGWDLSAIGSDVDFVEFKFYLEWAPESHTNGQGLQRGIGFDNLLVKTSDSIEPVTQLTHDIGQKTAPLEYVPAPGVQGRYYHVQRTRPGDNRLFLTANNVFFNPVNRLVSRGVGLEEVKQDGVSLPEYGDRGLNNGSSYAYVARWNDRDIAEWGVWLDEDGKLDVHVNTGGASGARFSLEIAGQAHEFESVGVNDDSIHLAASLEFEISEPGFHEVVLRCIESRDNLRMYWIELGGPAAKGGGVARARWRPAASHATFTAASMSDSDYVRMWVFELDAAEGHNAEGPHGFYGPMTTPFGYYGSSWGPDGQIRDNLNFTLWSYGQNDEEPDIEKLSQIIAMGNPEARFGGFSHEGTGVKVRDWDPFGEPGRRSQRQAFALRIEPGQPGEYHDRYYSYFFANDTREWILFGVGEKYNSTRANSRIPSEDMTMHIGSFVEVMGGANRERSGIYERRQRYRGWIMDQHGNWHNVDRMSYGNVNSSTGLTHTQRGIEDNGWFYNQTGGWYWHEPDGVSGQHVVHESPFGMGDVEYLSDTHIETLLTVPSYVELKGVKRIGDGFDVIFNVVNAGDSPVVSAFWGDSDKRAFMGAWDNDMLLQQQISEGPNTFHIPAQVPENEALFVRLLLENDEGRFFSFHTHSSDDLVHELFSINAQHGPHGFIEPAGTFQAFEGDTITVTAVPNSDHVVDQWSIDSSPVDDYWESELVISDISEDTNVYVKFLSKELDSDGDGMPDWMERIAGTDPDNQDCVLRLDYEPLAYESGPAFVWMGMAGRYYTLWSTTALGSTWAPVDGYINIYGENAKIEYTPSEAQSGTKFYRIAVSMNPIEID